LRCSLRTLAPPEPIQKVLFVLIVVVFILWLLSDMGLLGHGTFRISGTAPPRLLV
jgi:hypothetical protein